MGKSKLLAALTAAAFLSAGAAATAQETTIPISKWGKDDEIGAANLLTPELAIKAASLVTTGKVYQLGIPVDRATPAFPPRELDITILMPNQYQNTSYADNKMTYLDDTFHGWLGIGTQIDSLAHLGKDGVFYNQNKAKDFVSVTGVKKMGIEKIPAIVTRGVLINMAKHKGVEMMTEGMEITPDDIKAAAQAQGVSIEKGDVVVFHTGWLPMIDQDPKRYAAGEPGINTEAARYLASLEPVAVGADTWGIEAVPFKNASRVWEGHQVLLAENGIYILETLDTAAMAADGVTEFMFVLGQPLYTGAVQAIINPIAIR